MSIAAGNGIILALLAAGQSRRFGDQDKLTALLHGKMLGLHAAETLASLPFDQRIIVASCPDHPCTDGWKEMGYDIVANDHASEGQSTSVRCATASAIACNAEAICICLADMPYITCEHIEGLVRAFLECGRDSVIASSDHGKAMPPALFPSSQFAILQDVQGDQGARKLLQSAHFVPVDDGSLLDIDTPEILAMENRKIPGI